MRYVELMIPAGRLEDVLTILEEEAIEYVVNEDVSGREYDAVVSFPLASQAVEPFLDRLAAAGISDDASVVVMDVETIVSKNVTRLREQYGRASVGGGRISRQELETRAEDLTPAFPVYATMTLISAVVATAGLLLDSPAVVVGSMVIAPLIGPALAASIGSVIAEPELRTTGLSYQFAGLVIAVAGSIVLAGLVRVAGIEPAGVDIVGVAELEERVAPNLLSLVIALGAGVAGILSLTRKLSEAIVGVMIAAALIPPAAAAGIALAWGMYGAAAGATILTLVNALSVNFAALVTLWGGGYRPANLFAVTAAREQTLAFAVVLGVVMLSLLVPLVGATLVELEATQLESDVETDVDAVLADPAYADLESESVAVVLDTDYPIRSIERVTITVASSDPVEDDELVDRFRSVVAAHVDEPVVVNVQFVTAEETVADPGGDPAAVDGPGEQHVDRPGHAVTAGAVT